MGPSCSGGNPPMISVTEGESVSFECSFDGSPAVGNPFYEIIWMYNMTHKNVSKRILAFRMTRPNTSVPVSVTEGHFRGHLEFEKNTSSLVIPEVRVNDSGLYYCEVIIVPVPNKSRTNGTRLIVMGECLSFSLSFCLQTKNHICTWLLVYIFCK
uniref:Ig-like domain-containing protein n=1 Tax=Terrapene triunguis TaxID=2587831 RepID=A0A674J3W9_9SAUR